MNFRKFLLYEPRPPMIFWAPNTSPSAPICFECPLKFLNKSMNSSKHTKKLEVHLSSFWIKNQKIVWKSMLKSTLITKMLEFDNTLILSQVFIFEMRSTCQIPWQNSNILVIQVDFRVYLIGVWNKAEINSNNKNVGILSWNLACTPDFKNNHLW